VLVNNIQQEPGVGKSYTATGTTLTFDAAPSAGTANVYVVYRGLAEVTTRLEHDPNAALAATTGTFSGDLTVDTNTLYVDSTNNRVGVGTSSPSYKTEISDGTVTFGVNPLSAYSTVYAGTTTNHGMNFITNGNSRLNITSGGLVGIGTTAPYVNLESYVSATGAIPTNETVGVSTGNSNIAIGAFNANNSATFSGIALETRTSGASRWLIGNEWKNTYVGDLVFRNRNGGTTSQESMRIDSSGRVTMPYQPAFSFTGLSNSWATTGAFQTLIPASTKINRGNHYNGNTGVFTAPVSGVYFFGFWGLVYSNSGQVLNWQYSLNGGSGSQLVQSSGSTGNHTNTSGSIILSLAANDTVTLDVGLGSQTSAVPWPNQWNMYGYLMF